MKSQTNTQKSWTNLILTTVVYLGAIFLFANHVRYNKAKQLQNRTHQEKINQVISLVENNTQKVIADRMSGLKASIQAISRENEQLIGLSLISIVVFTILFGSYLSATLGKPDEIIKNITIEKTTKELVKTDPDKDWQKVFNLAKYPVIKIDGFNNVKWMNNAAQTIVGDSFKFKKVLNSLRSTQQGSMLARFNLKTYEIMKTQIENQEDECFIIQMVPMIQENVEYNTILNKEKAFARENTLPGLQPNFSNVVTELLVELNFIFQASNTLVQVAPDDTLLLINKEEIKPYLRSFILSIHQFIKESRGSNTLTFSTQELDERAALVIHSNKLSFDEEQLKYSDEQQDIRNIFDKWNEIETVLSSRFCAISMKQTVIDGVPCCEFIFSFENIPNVTTFNSHQHTLTA